LQQGVITKKQGSSTAEALSKPAQDSIQSRTPAADSGQLECQTTQTLDDLILSALRNSAAIKSAFSSYQSRRLKTPQLTALPDPELRYSMDQENGAEQHKIGVSQSFPWFGTLHVLGAQSDAESKAEFYRFLAVRNRLVYDVVEAYGELSYLKDSIQVISTLIQLLNSWERVLLERFRSSLGTHSDLVRTQIELGKLENQHSELLDALTPATDTLAALLNTDSKCITIQTFDLEASTARFPLSADAQASPETSVSENPELLMLDALIEAKALGINYAKKQYYPQLTLGVDYMFADNGHRSEEVKDALMPMASVSLPIFWTKYRAQELAAEESHRDVLHARNDKSHQLRAAMSQELYRLREATRQIALYRNTLIPKAEESIESSFTTYESGSSTFLDVLDSEQRLLEFKLSLSKASANRLKALAKLQMLQGAFTDLEPKQEDK
jgi:outer membrane protein TolC